jgi:hypothetical protein
MHMRRLFCAKHELVVGANETIPAWFQHAAVRENPPGILRSAIFASVLMRLSRLPDNMFVDI